MTLSEFLGHLEGVKGGGGQYSARCPSHDDAHNSLSVSIGTDGRVLLNCHAGCKPEDIVWSMGLTMRDLFVEDKPGNVFKAAEGPKGKPPPARFEAEYIYRDKTGAPLLKKVKMREPNGGKFCYWMHLKNGEWAKGRNGIVPPLYTTTDGKPLPGGVFLVEGEKDVDTLKALGKAAATLPDGAKSKWASGYGEALEGRTAAIIQDNDGPGKEFAQRVAGELRGRASSIKVLDLAGAWPELPEHGDVTDLIQHMGAEAGIPALIQIAKDTPEWEATAKAERPASPALSVISAVELQEKDIPPIRFIVDNLLPCGLNMLAAPSKYGKSWMVLALCLAVAAGRSFLGYRVNKCGCLYLALEDSERRLKGRMNKLLAGTKAPGGFYYATSAHDMSNGLFDELSGFLKSNPDTGLIVVDTLQKVRGPTQGKEGAYAADYREVGALKGFADQCGVAMLLVHHLRKMRDDGDPFNMISGTNGIMGAADTTMVLTKEKRGDDNATLSIVGRDVESSDTVLRFNKDTCHWENLGDADWLAEQRALLEYQESPIVKTIKKLLEQSAGGWSGTAQELMDAGRFIARTYLAHSTRELASKLKALDKPLFDHDEIVHDRARNGSGGGKHRFYYADAETEEHVQTEISTIPDT